MLEVLRVELMRDPLGPHARSDEPFVGINPTAVVEIQRHVRRLTNPRHWRTQPTTTSETFHLTNPSYIIYSGQVLVKCRKGHQFAACVSLLAICREGQTLTLVSLAALYHAICSAKKEREAHHHTMADIHAVRLRAQ